MRYPLFGYGQKGRSPRVTAQQRLNVYAEFPQDKNRAQIAFYGMPGRVLMAELGGTPVRGMHVTRRTDAPLLYAVVGNTVYSVTNAGTATSIGTLNTTDGRVDMDDNGLELLLVDGTNGYTYNFSTTTFAAISDGDYPDAATSCAFLGGYFVVNVPNTGQLQVSAYYDGTSWDAGDVATAESFSDDLTRVFSDGSELQLFGAESMEFWNLSGAVDLPFAPIRGASVEWGLAAVYSLVKFENSFCFLGKNRTGETQVMEVRGYKPIPISSPELESEINSYSSVSNATGVAYRAAGHPFYQINFPSGNASWVYDGVTKLWSKLQYSTTANRDRAEIGVQFVDKGIVSDYDTGDLYRIDTSVYTDNGEQVAREIVGRHIFDDDEITIAQLSLDIETGVGLVSGQGSDPQIMLQVSKDGGISYGSEKWRSLGKIGEYATKVRWRSLGASRDWTFKIRVADPVKFALAGAYVNAVASAQGQQREPGVAA